MEMTVATSKVSRNTMPMVIVAMLFFILGFATWLNGSLMPYLKQMLQLSPFQASLVLFSFYIAVTFTALPSAWLIRRVGYKNGMAIGMAVMMLAGLLYIPAAQTQTFVLFLLAQLVIGAVDASRPDSAVHAALERARTVGGPSGSDDVAAGVRQELVEQERRHADEAGLAALAEDAHAAGLEVDVEPCECGCLRDSQPTVGAEAHGTA